MTNMLRSRHGRVLFTFVAMVLFLATDALATHFRYGSITWRIENPALPNQVKVRFTAAFRWSYPWGSSSSCPAGFVPTGPTGTGACPAIGAVVNVGQITASRQTPSVLNNFQIQNANLTVTSINQVEDWFTGTLEYTLNVPTLAGNPSQTILLDYRGSARISTLQNGNNDRDWIIKSLITIRNPVNQPPTAATLPVSQFALNQANSFQIPASDPDGDQITFSASLGADSGLLTTLPPGLVLNSAGLVTWTPTVAGLYALQARVADTHGAYTVVDFVISVTNAPGAPPVVLLDNSPNPLVISTLAGQPVSFTVKATDPENTAVFLIGAGLPSGSTMTPTLPMTALNATSTFSWTPTLANAGTHVINFSATDGHGRQDTNAVTITVANATSAAATTTSVSANPAATSFGTPVTLTALVDAPTASVAPPGTVQFFVDGVLAGTVPVSAVTTTQSQATLTLASPSVANHTVTATYSGATSGGVLYQASTASQITFSVAKSATTTEIVSSPNPSQPGQSVTFTINVRPPSGITVVPTGTVTLSGALNQAVTLVNGSATVSTSTLPIGPNSVTAQYNGNAGFDPSSAGPYTHTVGHIATTTGVTSSLNPSTFGGAVTFTATVTPATTGPALSGTVQFMDGATNLGAPVNLVSGVAAITTSSLTAGPHDITAVYSGNSSFATSTSSTLVQNVNKATPTLNWAPIGPITYGTTLAGLLNATSSVPGTFAYTDGGTPITAATVLSANPVPYSLTATFTPTDTTNYESGGTVGNVLLVNKATPSLNWAPIGPITYGTTLAGLLNAGSNVPGTFAYAEGSTPITATTVLSANAIPYTLTSTFTPTDTINYSSGGTVTNSLLVNKATPVLSWAPLAPITYGTTLAGLLNASSNVPGTFAYTQGSNPITSTTVLSANPAPYALTATFTPTDTTNYTSGGTVGNSLLVNKATPVLNWAPIGPITFGTSLTGLLNASSDVPGTFAYAQGSTPLTEATILAASATPYALTATFTPTDTTNYTSGETVGNSLIVNKASPSLSWAPIAPITYGAALGGLLNANSSVAGTFVYTLGATPVTSATVLNASPIGTPYVLTATFTPADTSNYTSGGTVGNSLIVNKAPLVVTANNKVIIQGGLVHPLTGTIVGVTNGDNITAGYSTTATGMTAGAFPIVATAIDPNGRLVNYDVTLNNAVLTVVPNQAPVITSLTAPVNPSQLGTSIQAQLTFTDADVAESRPYQVRIEWGDGSTAYSTTVQDPGTVIAAKTYAAPGVYRITATVSDKIAANSAVETFEFVVIFDPNGGFVTGGGWIISPIGACSFNADCMTQSDRANYGFVSKYEKGTTVPSGQTQFQFQAGDLNFHSTSYQWLVVAGARAQYKGFGRINGTGNYGFILTAIDGQIAGGGGVDKFRIKIWDINNNDTVVYDNELGLADDGALTTSIAGGSIVIHEAKKK